MGIFVTHVKASSRIYIPGPDDLEEFQPAAMSALSAGPDAAQPALGATTSSLGFGGAMLPYTRDEIAPSGGAPTDHSLIADNSAAKFRYKEEDTLLSRGRGNVLL